MSQIGILAYQNENNNNAYPLTTLFSDLTINFLMPGDFITAASFVQFDGFIPSVTGLSIFADLVILTITYDRGVSVINIDPNTFVNGQFISIYDGARFIGKLSFGDGVTSMSGAFSNRIYTMNIPFCASVVRSVNSGGGLYSLAGLFGDISIATTPDIFFDISGNVVTCNAIHFPVPLATPALKTLNGVGPLNNDVTLEDRDIIKIQNSPSTNTVTINSISSSVGVKSTVLS